MKKPILIAIVTFLLLSIATSAIALSSSEPPVLSTYGTQNSEVYIHIGSPLLLSQNDIMPLDPDNLDVAATIESNRTLVPLRAISEYFNAKVSYDSVKRRALIEFDGKQFIFPINSNKYIETNGNSQEEISMDTRTKIMNGRTMVPLRVICEDILGQKVSYYDKVIAISKIETNLKDNKTLVSNIKSKIGSALKVQSLSELKTAISNQTYLYGDVRRNEGSMAAEISNSADVSEKSSASPAPAASSENATQYSSTNTQVQGIDEADIVKTDGKYIYIAGNNAVRIVSADKGKLDDISIIKLPQDKNVSEIFIDENRLILVGTRYERVETQPYIKDPAPNQKPGMDTIKMVPYYSKNYSYIDIYDISTPKTPKFIKGHEMEGNYQSSRKNGSIVYLITNAYAYNGVIVPNTKDIPSNNKAVPLSLKDIMIMPDCIASGYVIVSAININSNEKTQVEAITTSGHLTYMNNSALYLAANNYDGTSTITKFKINGMNIGYAGSGKVPGYILNQFSMDEFEGYFRVATTSNTDNNLYVLDNSLNICGSVTGLAKGERIYSVRFMGNKGYIVTFRTIDPLFVFDLSNPKNPKVTGELKIPGFSNYLHPVGENLILGIGQDTYEIYKKDSSGNEVVIGTRQGGIKLSLFDVSDMGKPKEISNYVLGDSGSYTDVFYDHKAAMFDYASNNVIFDAFTNDVSGVYKRGAAIFNFGGRSLKLKGIVDYIQPEVSGMYIPYGRRIIYIGNELYYIQDGIVASYNYTTLTPIDKLALK